MSKASFHLSAFKSLDIDKKPTDSFLDFAIKLLKSGILLMQGKHQLPQKLITMYGFRIGCLRYSIIMNLIFGNAKVYNATEVKTKFGSPHPCRGMLFETVG